MIECVWVEIEPAYSKSILICVLYRPPSDKSESVDYFHNMFNVPYGSNYDIIVMGDFNFYILKPNTRNVEWNNTVCHFNLHQLVDCPTRVAENSSTLIDHVYTTNEELIENLSVPQIRLSDHFPVYFTF